MGTRLTVDEDILGTTSSGPVLEDRLDTQREEPIRQRHPGILNTQVQIPNPMPSPHVPAIGAGTAIDDQPERCA